MIRVPPEIASGHPGRSRANVGGPAARPSRGLTPGVAGEEEGGVLARLRFVVVIALLPAALVLAAPGARAAVPGWAPAATATVHPGTQTYTQSSQCTANFVYLDGVHVYLGQ